MTDSATFEVQSLFYQGAYRSCIDAAAASSSSSSGTGEALRKLYAARAHVALSGPQRPSSAAVSKLLSSSSSTPAASAVKALSAFVDAFQTHRSDAQASALQELNDLEGSTGAGGSEDEIVKTSIATARYLSQDSLGALEVLGMGKANSREIECIALGVHILLSINRPDVAQREYLAARSWADDSLLIQLIEASIGLYQGGRSSNQAYYVYDELAQNPTVAGGAASVPSLIGKAISKIYTGERTEAIAVLKEAEALDPENAEVLANQVVLHTGTDSALAQEYISRLRSVAPTHQLLTQLNEAEAAFDRAAADFANELASNA